MMVTHKPDDLYYVGKILFLAKGGFLTYYGSKEDYLEFFDAKNVIEVYAKNRTLEQGEYWSAQWKDQHPSSGIVQSETYTLTKQRDESFFKQLFWLTARYFNIKTNDRTNTFILLAQAPIIAGLLGLIFDELELSVLFLMTISAIWFGTNNSAKEIVGELPIYRRERCLTSAFCPISYQSCWYSPFSTFCKSSSLSLWCIFTVGTPEVGLNAFGSYVGLMSYLAFSGRLVRTFCFVGGRQYGKGDEHHPDCVDSANHVGGSHHHHSGKKCGGRSQLHHALTVGNAKFCLRARFHPQFHHRQPN